MLNIRHAIPGIWTAGREGQTGMPSEALERSRALDAMAKTTGMWMAAMPSEESTAGFKTFQDRAVLFAKQNAEASFAVASELTNAKNIQDLLAIQSRYAQTQMQAYALQAQEFARLMSEAAQRTQPRS